MRGIKARDLESTLHLYEEHNGASMIIELKIKAAN